MLVKKIGEAEYAKRSIQQPKQSFAFLDDLSDLV